MDKLSYLAELAEGLARWVPERERQDILRYYAEYFEEAGPDREAQVVAELGDPWALSCRLAVEGGYTTWEQANRWTPPKKKKWPWLLAAGITAAVLLFTVVSIAMGAAAFGRLVGRNVAAYVTSSPEAKVEEADNAQFGAAYEGDPESTGGIPAVYQEGEGDAGSGEGFWAREDGCLDAFSGIDAEISFGRITVCAGRDYSLSIARVGDLGGYELKWKIEDGRLKIQDAKPGGFQMNLNGLMGEHSLSVDITVPDNVRLEKANVKTSLGDILLSDLTVEKKLNAKTNLGDVEVYGVSAQELEAKSDLGEVECHDSRVAKEINLDSSMGDVTLSLEELSEGLEIELKTNLGQVEASLGCAEQECGYELKCSLGKVTVNGVGRGDKAVQKGNCPYQLEAKSDLGDVDVDFIR